MSLDTKNQLHNLVHLERLCVLRNWFLGLGALALVLALMAVMNTVGNPKTWASAYNAFAAVGAFFHMAMWFAGVGCLLILLGALFAFWVVKKRNELL